MVDVVAHSAWLEWVKYAKYEVYSEGWNDWMVESRRIHINIISERSLHIAYDSDLEVMGS